MIRSISCFLLILLLISCDEAQQNKPIPQRIEIGEFVLWFSTGYVLQKEHGTDSYVGKISNGKIDFQFDYGYYADPLEKSIDEYLRQDVWKWNALGQQGLLPSGSELSALSREITWINTETNDSITYTNHYRYKGDTIAYPITVPEDIRNVIIELDTSDHVVYKRVRKPGYVGLYAKNLRAFHPSINAHTSLSLVANQLTKQESEEAYRVVRSCRIRK